MSCCPNGIFPALVSDPCSGLLRALGNTERIRVGGLILPDDIYNAIFPSGWVGYATATPDNPLSQIDNFSFEIDLSEMPSEWWAAAPYKANNLRVSTGENILLPIDVIYYDKSATTGLVIVQKTKTTSDEEFRVWTGDINAPLSLPDGKFGQYNAYRDSIRGFWPLGAGPDRTRWGLHLDMTSVPNIGAYSGPYTGAKSSSYNGSSSTGRTTHNVPNGSEVNALSFVTWANTNDSSSFQQILAIYDSNDEFNDERRTDMNTSAILRAIEDNGGTASITPGTISSSTWHHCVSTFNDKDDRQVYLDGGNKGTNTGNRSGPLDYDTIKISGLQSGGGRFWDGFLSLSAVILEELNDDYVAYHHSLGNQSTFWNGWTWTPV